MPGERIFELVGRYGGATGIELLIVSAVILALAKMKGSAKQMQSRFNVLWKVFLVLAASILAGQRWLATNAKIVQQTIIQNHTDGSLSPVVNDNHGSISVSDQSRTTSEGSKK